MACHKVDYEILGSEMQIVEVELDPGETVVAEAGAMNYMEDGIEFVAKMGDGSEPEQGFFGKLASAGKRMLTGECVRTPQPLLNALIASAGGSFPSATEAVHGTWRGSEEAG